MRSTRAPMTPARAGPIVWRVTNEIPPDIRKMRWVGLMLLTAFAVGIATDEHGAGTHGRGLAVSIAFAGYVTALVLSIGIATVRARWAFDRHPGWRRSLTLLLLSASAAVLFGLQENGYAVIGLYTVASVAGLRFAGPLGYALLAWVLVGYDLALVLGRDHHGVFDVLSNDVGFVMLFLVTRFVARMREGKEEAERLVAELRESREAESRSAALAERGRIAREMHDVLAHSLSALAVQLEGARLLARDRATDADVVEAIEKAHHLAAGGLEEARRTIEALRGDDLPGPSRLAALAESFGEQAGVETSFDVAGEARELSSEARLALYRTAQEALTNVRKHARPERVDLHLRYGEHGTSLVVEDHGTPQINGALADTGGGYGLSGMRERAELLGGRLVAAPTGDGFRVELWLPA
jgi:signal transduction histidine kinase